MSLEQRYDQAVQVMRLGLHYEATNILTEILQEAPKNGYVWGTLGLAYLSSGHVLRAEDAFRKAIRFDGQTTIWREQLGYILPTRGKIEEALSLVEGLQSAGADLVRAFAYEYLADYQRALDSLLVAEDKVARAKFVDDGRTVPPEVWWAQGLLLKSRCYRRLGEPQKALEVCAQLGSKGDTQALAFEKAWIYHQIGDWASSWSSLLQANQGSKFDLVKFRAKRVLERNVTRTHQSTRDGSRFVFIVGIPRSGTSLVEQILSQHAQVVPMGERNDLTNIVNRLGSAGWPDLQPDELNSFADMYIGATAATEKGQLVTDKLPDNWRHTGLIQQLLPGAKIVHCVRNPEDVLLSCFQQNFASSGMGWASSLEGLRTYYEEWRKTEVPGFQLRYEELVHEPERVIRELLDYLGLPFEEDCLYPDRSDRVVATASYAQVKKPITPKSVGKGRHYMEWLGEILPGRTAISEG